MNKLVKGAVAGAAGIALLVGGAGTFALWNSSAEVNASTISAGTLSLSTGTAGVWTNITNGASTVINPSNFKIVPGNKLQFTQALTVNATGDQLSADLTYNALSITGTNGLNTLVTTNLAVTSTDAHVVAATAPRTFTVTPSSTTATVNVVLTVELPASVTTGQGGTIDLSKLTFTLTQKAIA